MLANAVYMYLLEACESKVNAAQTNTCKVFKAGESAASANDAQNVEYWTYVLGFFTWHHTLAMFHMDLWRLSETEQVLGTAVTALGLPSVKEWEHKIWAPSTDAVFLAKDELAKALEREFGWQRVWSAESGYLTGMVLASLAGQAESKAPDEIESNLKILQVMLIPTIIAVEIAGLPAGVRNVLYDIREHLGKHRSRESAEHCKGMLEPVVRRLLSVEIEK